MSNKLFFILGIVISLIFVVDLASQNADVSIRESIEEAQVSESVLIFDSREEESGDLQEFFSTDVSFSNQELYLVERIVDGDTIIIKKNGISETVRLIGIDTPEVVDPHKPVQCFGKEASDKAKELLSGRRVWLEFDETQGERDKYGRLLAYVHLDSGLFFSEYMVKNGYAYEYTYKDTYRYQKEFKKAQEHARFQQAGLWANGVCDKFDFSSTNSSSTEQFDDHIFYVSTYSSARYYYCDTGKDWKNLSEIYRESYFSEDNLLNNYPERVLREPCKQG